MTTFVPPTSGVLLGALVGALSLRQTSHLKSSTARKYFSGAAINDEGRVGIVEDFVDGLFDADLVDWPAGGPNRPMVVDCILQSARAWDELVGRYRGSALEVPNTPVAGHAFARVAVVDLALRFGALCRRCDLPPSPETPADKAPGLLLRRLLHDRNITRAELCERARVSITTVDTWCDAFVSMSAENMLDVAFALEPTNDVGRGEVVRRLRRHLGFWQLRRAAVFLGDDFLDDAVSALVRIANAVNAGLGQSRLSEPHRTAGLEATVMLGRCFKSTLFLRKHAARTEPDAHWRAALLSDDLRYVEGHAQWLAGVEELRTGAAQLPGIDDVLLDALERAPVPGFAPTSLRGPFVVVSGDASFKANNREASSHAAEAIGDLPRAIEEMRHAVRLEPTKALWHFKLGALLGQAGHVDEGIAECRIAAAMEPWDLPSIEIGIILLDARRPREALAALLDARRRIADPSSHLLYHLGLAHFDVDDVEEAIGCFRSALEQKPDDPACMNMMAEALFARAERLTGVDRRRTNEEALRFAKVAALHGRRRALDRWASRRKG